MGLTRLSPARPSLGTFPPTYAQDRGFSAERSAHAQYDPVEFLAHFDILDVWNSSAALQEGDTGFTAAIDRVAKRAIAARKGRKVGPREFNVKRSAVLRNVHS